MKKIRLIEGTEILEKDEMIEIIKKEEYGIISTIGEDGIPYGFPMSYILQDECIYFHCALEGHKIDNINYNNNVCFNVVGETKLIPEDLDTAYESVIAFGKVMPVKDREEKISVLLKLVDKYARDFKDKGIVEANRDVDITGIYKIKIDEITGKKRRL